MTIGTSVYIPGMYRIDIVRDPVSGSRA